MTTDLTASAANHVPVLVAEDDEIDALLLRRAFQKAGLPNDLVIVHDGQEAIEYLNGDAPYTDRSRHPLPGLLLLDLKMPRMTGFDALAWLSEKPQFKDLPKIILSSSSHESDVERARQMGASDYRIKPHGFDQLVQIVLELHARWLCQAESSKSGNPT